tara:strand:+ start:3754 stop:4293 length:540 start_codon:yes stop_codon:yes gene_type:complete
MSRLLTEVMMLYKKVLKEIPLLVDGKIHGIYNSKRVRITGKKNKHSYEGYTLCGAASHVLYKNLDKPVKKYIMKKGKGRTYEDHVHLRYSNILIDPTYRQMFRTNYGKGDEEYFKILYEKNLPFFVGTLNDMEALYNKLNGQHKKDFNISLESPMDFYTEAWKYKERKHIIRDNIHVLL